MAEYDLLVSAAFGMEAIVVRELKELGYENPVVEDGKIRFRAKSSAICRTNLWLRCAERVQVVVADFRAKNFDELFDQVKATPWEEWLAVDAKFPVTARCVRSDIRSVPNTQKMVKRAIVDRLRQVYMRHWFEESGTEYNVDCNIVGDRVLLTIDATGDGLHKRGYRKLVGQAPLRETVAAGLVKLSYWNRDRLLVDPFCGSGTIPIEAAMIARNLAPGRNRSFQAENWPQIPRSDWIAARQEVKDLENRQQLSVPIIATDRDRSAIKIAVQAARQAGVSTDIHFDVKDFIAFPTNRDAGVLICNPPYGERLGDADEVRQLYRDMGELLRPLDDWSLYILTSYDGFEREFGKRADRRRKLYNARIACTFYQYLGPKPGGPARTDEPATEDASSFDPEFHRERDTPVESFDDSDESEVRPAFVQMPEESVAPVEERPAPPAPPVVEPSKNPWLQARAPRVSRPEPTPEPEAPSSVEDAVAATEESAPVIEDVARQPEEPAPQPIQSEPIQSESADQEAPRFAEESRPESEEVPSSPTDPSPLPAPNEPVHEPTQQETQQEPQQTAPESPAPVETPPAAESEEKNPDVKHPWKKMPWKRK